jgi:hypothetical protein
MSAWKWALFFFSYFIAPMWVGYVTAFPYRFGPAVTVVSCVLFLVCFAIGVAIKYWLGNG